MKIIKQSLKIVNKVSLILKNGRVVICPTDTIYGFLADAQNKEAVDKIFKIKKRPRKKPLPIFVNDLKKAREIAEINEKQEKVLSRYWPGRYTFVLKRKPGITLYGIDKNTIAIRVPKHAFLNSLLKKVNRPLVQTSTNISRKDVLDTIDGIIKKFNKEKIIIIDGGDIKKGKPSKIIDLTNNKNKILRP